VAGVQRLLYNFTHIPSIQSKVTRLETLPSHPFIKRLNDSEIYDRLVLSCKSTNPFHIRALEVCAQLTIDLSKFVELETMNHPPRLTTPKDDHIMSNDPNSECDRCNVPWTVNHILFDCHHLKMIRVRY
jgi:hypothetical protein